MAEPQSKRRFGCKLSSLAGLVIADDLTGACDAALSIRKSGVNVSVVESHQCLRHDTLAALEDQSLDSLQVLVVNNNARQDASQAELEDFYAAIRQFFDDNNAAVPVYLKVDSSLRGQLGKDIAMAMSHLDYKRCICAPALPEAGRTTIGGVHLLHGVPVSLALKRDSLTATTHPAAAVGKSVEALPGRSSIASLLQSGHHLANAHVKSIDVDTVVAGWQNISTALNENETGDEADVTVAVIDVLEQQHLHDLALAVSQQQQGHLLVGSAGLAGELATAWNIPTGGTEWPKISPKEGVVVFVVGSDTLTSNAQVQCLRASTPAILEVDASSDSQVHDLSKLNFQQSRESGSSSARTPGAILLTLSQNNQAGDSCTDEVGKLTSVAKDLVVRLGSKLAGLVVSGGYTLQSLLAKCQVTEGVAQRFDVVGEVSSCTPLLRVVGGALDDCLVISKGGRLGENDVFVQALKKLCSRDVRMLRGVRQSQLPVLAITMGDVAGIGPEIVAKVMQLPETWQLCRPVVVGSVAALQAANIMTNTTVAPLQVDSVATIDWDSVYSGLAPAESGEALTGKVPVVSSVECDYKQIPLGQVSCIAGRCAAEWVIQAVKLCLTGDASAIVTAPLNKESMNKAGYHYAGHTELLAKESGARTSRLMLASEKMKVVHATGHCSLADVATKLTVERLAETIVMSGEFLRNQGIAHPRIAIAGLNPHAGDGGLFGTEEAGVLTPAIAQCRAKGWTVSDPIPSDTLFCRTLKGEFDIVVAMYHDQGHIPAKLIDFGSTVNVTLGLPIIRTSVDHGTAFDIAGRGIADPSNLLHAIRLASKMVPE